MNSNKMILLALALLTPTAAFSAPRFACTSAEELDKRSEECSDNPHYTKAGEACLSKLEDLLAKATKTSPKKVRENADSELAKKKSKRAKKGFGLPAETNEELLAAAKIAKEALGAYRDNIFYPEDWDAPEELIGDPEDFLDSQPCYATARDRLEEIEETIDFYVDELKRGGN